MAEYHTQSNQQKNTKQNNPGAVSGDIILRVRLYPGAEYESK